MKARRNDRQKREVERKRRAVAREELYRRASCLGREARRVHRSRKQPVLPASKRSQKIATTSCNTVIFNNDITSTVADISDPFECDSSSQVSGSPHRPTLCPSSNWTDNRKLQSQGYFAEDTSPNRDANLLNETELELHTVPSSPSDPLSGDNSEFLQLDPETAFFTLANVWSAASSAHLCTKCISDHDIYMSVQPTAYRKM